MKVPVFIAAAMSAALLDASTTLFAIGFDIVLLFVDFVDVLLNGFCVFFLKNNSKTK